MVVSVTAAKFEPLIFSMASACPMLVFRPTNLSCLKYLGTDSVENTAPLSQCDCCHGIVAFVLVGGVIA
jgi:hypothetical protein